MPGFLRGLFCRRSCFYSWGSLGHHWSVGPFFFTLSLLHSVGRCPVPHVESSRGWALLVGGVITDLSLLTVWASYSCLRRLRSLISRPAPSTTIDEGCLILRVAHKNGLILSRLFGTPIGLVDNAHVARPPAAGAHFTRSSRSLVVPPAARPAPGPTPRSQPPLLLLPGCSALSRHAPTIPTPVMAGHASKQCVLMLTLTCRANSWVTSLLLGSAALVLPLARCASAF